MSRLLVLLSDKSVKSSQLGCLLMTSTTKRHVFHNKYFSTNHLFYKKSDNNLCKQCFNRYLRTNRQFVKLNNSHIFNRNNNNIILDEWLRCTPSVTTNSVRYFQTNRVLYEKDSSKVEQTVKALREEQKELKDKTSEALIEGTGQVVTEVVAVPPKRSLGKRVWDELVHYYHGFRLLFIDIGVGRRLLWKVMNGEDLTRREHRQLVRTTSDIFRLVPFSVFVIVPFMELLLPVFIKLFPNMLPSTFQSAETEETKMKKELKLKLEMAKFLQNTLDEMTLQAKGETHSAKAKDFALFFNKVRNTGEQASNEDIIKFSKLFEDEITLDSLSRLQLSALCRLLELQPIGTNNFLRFQLRMKLRSLNADDQMINKEGVDSLTVPELIQACRARGMRALGIPEVRLRSQLSQWLELSLNEKIPPSLLLLSRVLYLPENIAPADQLKATIQSLPDSAATEARYKIGETEGKIDNKTKIELIRKEEEAIKKEKEEEEQLKQQKLREQEILIDKAINLESQLKEKLKDEELSKEDINSIENALENVAKEKDKLLIEKEELEDLKEELKDYKEDIEEFKEISDQTGQKTLKETKAAQRLRNKVNNMVNKMDVLFDGLESKKQSLEQKINILSKEGKTIQQERDDVVGINELLGSIRRLQKVGDDAKLQRILEVLDNMDVDHDGSVEVEHVVKVLELLGRENVNVSSNQVKDIINLLIQEEKLEEEKKRKLKEEKEVNGKQMNNNKQENSKELK
ncbi:mitochondrial proton/calcium exchanger protein-like [Oppia nitens]|uniref:mitochondrial proton/calcium exchanger protein-like n=1 Tax=Oppia nitens TaxID=1686743 RepID=UPI0023DCE6C7|nr:mitochondrial proton/calcium exchanger protein-like [Oppia nitens]